MHRRFEGAATATLSCPGGTIEAVLAQSYRLRLIGLMGLDTEEMEPLLFPRCGSIQTMWMKAPIDLVWLGRDGDHEKVIGVVEGLAPRRSARAPRGDDPRRSTAALELPAGDASRLGLDAGAALAPSAPRGPHPA